MNYLFGLFTVLGLIAGTCVFTLVIMAFIMIIVNKITYKKRKQKAINEFYKNLNELGNALEKINVNKEKPKKPTKTKKKAKEEK